MEKELGGVEGKETVVGMYCMRKESIFTKKKKVIIIIVFPLKIKPYTGLIQIKHFLQ